MSDKGVPEPVTFSADNPPAELPGLPEGYVWKLDVTATAEVIHPDGTKD